MSHNSQEQHARRTTESSVNRSLRGHTFDEEEVVRVARPGRLATRRRRGVRLPRLSTGRGPCPPVIAKGSAGRTLPVLLLALSAALLVSCGDDDDSSGTTSTTTAEQAYCADGDQLESDLSALADLELPDDGTDAVQAQIDALKTDLSALKSSAADVASTEITTFETSLDDLEAAANEVTGELTASSAANVVVAIEDAVAAGGDVVSTLQTTCP